MIIMYYLLAITAGIAGGYAWTVYRHKERVIERELVVPAAVESEMEQWLQSATERAHAAQN